MCSRMFVGIMVHVQAVCHKVLHFVHITSLAGLNFSWSPRYLPINGTSAHRLTTDANVRLCSPAPPPPLRHFRDYCVVASRDQATRLYPIFKLPRAWLSPENQRFHTPSIFMKFSWFFFCCFSRFPSSAHLGMEIRRDSPPLFLLLLPLLLLLLLLSGLQPARSTRVSVDVLV